MKKYLKRLLVGICVLLIVLVAYTLSSNWLISKCISKEKYNYAVLIYNYQIYKPYVESKSNKLFEDKLLILDESFYLDDDLNEDTFEADYENKYYNYAEWLNTILMLKNCILRRNILRL